jgi:ubiquinone/menaquinone biosynthesis C-methylase UbiE
MSKNGQWQLDGNAAELYERYVVRYILGRWVPGLLDIAAVRPGERVLDVACGTGAVARAAAKRVGVSGRVTGLDLNAGMLAVAQSLPPPPGAAITWIQRDAADTKLSAGSFDVVVCQQGLQFFPDKTAALRDLHRVLVSGGRLAISVWRTTGVYNSAVGKALGQHVSVDVASRFCASRQVPAGDELLRWAVAAGFQEVKLHVQQMIARLPSPEEFVLGHLAATPVASEVKAMSSPARAALGRAVARLLSAYQEGSGLAFPEEINVVTASA